MNAERLKALVEELLEYEKKTKLQKHLTGVSNAINNLVSQPQRPEHQVAFSNALKSVSEAISSLSDVRSPAQRKRLEEVGAERFFGEKMVEDIRRAIEENPITPAVVQQQINELLQARQAYLQNLETTSTNLAALGIESDDLEEGSAEIGFQLPRDLFHNQLDDLIKELGVIKRVLRAFSELATGSVEPIVVRQISTTDPIFFFALDTITIAKLGGAVTWALHTWKQIEDIRKVRLETAKLKSFSQDEVDKIFGGKIRETIGEAIEAKTTELIEAAAAKPGRKEEQRTDIAWSLESILARVERGMTVELRFLPPPASKETKDGAAKGPAEDAPAFEELREIAPQLVFPAPDPSPALALPPAEPENKEAKKENQGRA